MYSCDAARRLSPRWAGRARREPERRRPEARFCDRLRVTWTDIPSLVCAVLPDRVRRAMRVAAASALLTGAATPAVLSWTRAYGHTFTSD